MSERPETPSDQDNGESKSGPPKQRNFASFALIGLVLLIVWLVISSNNQDANKVDMSTLHEHMALGHVESLDIRETATVVKLQDATQIDGKKVKELSIAIPRAKLGDDQVRLMNSLTSMGRLARNNRDEAKRVLLQLQEAEDNGKPVRFAVYERFLFHSKGKDRLLVSMSMPPASNMSNSVSGNMDAAQDRRTAFLFEPQVLKSMGKTHEFGIKRLLELTNTVDENKRLGLPAPYDVTVRADAIGKSPVTWSEGSGLWEKMLLGLVPWLVIIAILWFVVFRQMRSQGMGGNVLSFGRSRAKIANREKSKITFADVAGIEEAKDEVSELVEFLKHPGRFARLGGRMPRGVLLVGSPGTGKTLLAKAIAGEAEVPFFSICGSDFVEMFVGVGASRVRDLFKQARENSPCIIFLDEIDAVGRRRGAGLGGGHDEREQTLNAILVEMDGFETDTGIVVVAATNRADVLDPALLRPGRFDRQITVDLPDVKGREAILKVHSRKVRMHPNVDFNKIARGTPGFSGAELEAVINEGAIQATMEKKDFVEERDLEEGRDRVRWGRAKSSRIMDAEELKLTAYHEAGHAMTSLLLPGADPIHKVTIVPRGQALGATMYLPEKDSYSLTVGKAETHLKICFGGRIAEEMFFDDYTSGAANDIKQATSIARRMIREWGMSEELGPINYSEDEENVFLGRDLGRRSHIGQATTDRIDIEVKRIITEAFNSCRELLEAHREKLEILAEALLEYEVLSREEIEGLMEGVSIADTRASKEADRKSQEREFLAAEAASSVVSEPKPAYDDEADPQMPSGLAPDGPI